MEIDKKYKRIRNSGYALMGAKWVSILSPFIAIGIANYDEYFTEYNGVKMSIGCVLALAVMGIAIYNEAKDKNKKVSGIVGWAVALALAYLLQSVLNDLVLILGCGLIGQMIGAGFELGGKVQLEKAKLYKESIIQAESFKQ